ncbi:hypothetical protein [Labrenzia sp. CE80]|uniref:hypothetical protein n=1 Tax=Labrenzia sp. CE80 TaxID=1788986 RepID=UPI001389603C|nr:hypothetical protein [Labrenzia sp. CE80]
MSYLAGCDVETSQKYGLRLSALRLFTGGEIRRDLGAVVYEARFSSLDGNRRNIEIRNKRVCIPQLYELSRKVFAFPQKHGPCFATCQFHSCVKDPLEPNHAWVCTRALVELRRLCAFPAV